jgi:hypothetical protein
MREQIAIEIATFNLRKNFLRPGSKMGTVTYVEEIRIDAEYNASASGNIYKTKTKKHCNSNRIRILIPQQWYNNAMHLGDTYEK